MNLRHTSHDPIRQGGFTLVELMIVVLIVGLLAMVAFPSYEDTMVKSRRGVGKSAILELISRQQSYFLDRKSFADCPTDLGYLANTAYIGTDGQMTADSSSAAYALTIDECGGADTTPSSYTARATPIKTDSSCGVLVVTSRGQKGSGGSATADTNGCWKK